MELRPRAVVFDLWFTLVTPEDFQQPYVSPTKRIPEELGLAPDAFLQYWESCQPRQHRQPRPLLEDVGDYLSELGRTMTARERASFDALWQGHDLALTSPRPDVLSALHDLAESGLRLGLLSNAHEREVRAWTDSPLAQLFHEACFSCHLGHVKPEPEAYASILRRLGVPANETVFVGDGASSELQGARSAGIRWTVWMRGFYDAWGLAEETTRGYLDQADATVRRIGDLRGVLGELSP